MTATQPEPAVLPGAEPMSATGDRRGVLVVHGFTGSPQSMRPVAEGFAAAGWTVELPRLPGHGTTVEDMAGYGWPDWTAAVDAAYTDLAARTDAVVVVGLSMGGSLTLWLAAEHPEIAGIVPINAAAESDDFAGMVEQVQVARGQGATFVPGVGDDVADAGVVEVAYTSLPVSSFLSFAAGMADLKARLGSVRVPALIIHSTQDHVVPPGSNTLLEAALAGPHETLTLERSYHVATIDHDRDLIVERALAFADSVVKPAM